VRELHPIGYPILHALLRLQASWENADPSASSRSRDVVPTQSAWLELKRPIPMRAPLFYDPSSRVLRTGMQAFQRDEEQRLHVSLQHVINQRAHFLYLREASDDICSGRRLKNIRGCPLRTDSRKTSSADLWRNPGQFRNERGMPSLSAVIGIGLLHMVGVGLYVGPNRTRQYRTTPKGILSEQFSASSLE
jgi:hypothetical protein